MKLIFVLLLSYFLASLFLSSPMLPIILILAVVYLRVLLKYPEIGLFFVVLVAFNCYSMMNENILRLPYLFKVRDLLFVSLLVPLCLSMYHKNYDFKPIFLNPIAKCIYMIIFLSIVQILVTKCKYPSESIASMFRVGRKYFYYALFFPGLYTLTDSKQLIRFLKLFIMSIVLFCILYILQFIVGSSHKIFIAGTVGEQTLQGFGVTRLYISGIPAAALLFHISIMMLMFTRFKHYRKPLIVMVALSGLQTLVTFGRAHIFGVISGFLLGVSLAWREKRIKVLAKAFSILLCGVILLGFFSKMFLPREKDFVTAITARMASTYSAVAQKDDTFGYRLQDSRGRMQLVGKNILFGVGFLSDGSSLASKAGGYNRTLRSGDSGTLDMLIDFGIIGLIWLALLSITFLARCMQIYRNSNNKIEQSVVLGLIAFYFGRLFSFITLGDFINYDGIVTITLVLVFTELLARKAYAGT